MTSTVRRSRATPLLVWLTALLALLVTAPRSADAADYDRDVDVSTFYDELEDDGDWIEHPRHGYVWTPAVDDDWRPYTRGRWENTEEHGWYWDSEEPFGWAVYHYGRWGYDDDIGWYWVPGRKWGPAWVDWRHSDDEIGWRPLAPDEDWEPSGSLRIRAAYYDEPTYAPRWIFVSPRYFVEPSIHLHLFPRTQSVVFLGRTRRVTTYRVVNQRIVNTGLTISFVQRYAPRPIVARRITVTETRFVRPGTSTTVINVYRPKALRTTTTTTTVRLSKPRTVVNRTVVVDKKKRIVRPAGVAPAAKIGPAGGNGQVHTLEKAPSGPTGGGTAFKPGQGSDGPADGKGLTPKERRALNKAKQQQGPSGGSIPSPIVKGAPNTGPGGGGNVAPSVAKSTPAPGPGGPPPQGKKLKQGQGGGGPDGGKSRGPNAGGQGGGGGKAALSQGQAGPAKKGGGQGDDTGQKKKKQNPQNQP